MAEQAANSRVATVASGMFISRITSEDTRRTSYDIHKVTDIEGFVVDTWSLIGEYGDGVSLVTNDKLGKTFLVVGPKVSGIIRISASNEKYVKKQQELGYKIDVTEVILTTTIFSFYYKIKAYKELVKSDDSFFIKIGRSMDKSTADRNLGDFISDIGFPIEAKSKKLND